MIRTRVGYTGGTKDHPTYRSLGDHSETVEVDFDPTVVSYVELLRAFWKSHDPLSSHGARQYMSAIFYHGARQQKLALESRDREAVERGGKILTEILPASRFYRAEDYHQKYYLRMKAELMRKLRTIYPSEERLVDSTLAARLNAYFAGYGNMADLEAEIGAQGLPAEQRKLVMDLVRSSL